MPGGSLALITGRAKTRCDQRLNLRDRQPSPGSWVTDTDVGGPLSGPPTSGSGFLDVGEQDPDPAGGQAEDAREQRGRLGRRNGGAGRVVVGEIEVQHAVGRRRRAVLLGPDLRRL